MKGVNSIECDTRENAIRACDNYYLEIQRMLKNKEDDDAFYDEILDEQEKTITKQRAALKKIGQTKRSRGKALIEARESCFTNSVTLNLIHPKTIA